MFDDLIIDFKRPIKALRSTKIEEFEVIIFAISINLQRCFNMRVPDEDLGKV